VCGPHVSRRERPVPLARLGGTFVIRVVHKRDGPAFVKISKGNPVSQMGRDNLFWECPCTLVSSHFANGTVGSD
jgi:hypothetical protein